MNWNFMKILRVIIALTAIYQAIEFYKVDKSVAVTAAALGVFLIMQVVFNVGCASGNCTVPLPSERRKAQ